MSLSHAEFLKLRRRRGLVAACAALTLAPMLVALAVLSILHAGNPAKHGPAGGVANLADMLNVLSVLAGVAGVLIGATAGAGDLGAGIFRDLVATGRSRSALFAARVPGGLALTVPLVLAAFAVAASGSIVLAGSLPAPGAEQIVRAGGWIALSASFSFVLALGIGSALGSRGMTIGVLLGWQLAIAPMLAGLEGLGSLRVGLDYAALQKLHPAAIAAGGRGVAMSAATAALVLAAWIALTLGAGAWRTATRDT